MEYSEFQKKHKLIKLIAIEHMDEILASNMFLYQHSKSAIRYIEYSELRVDKTPFSYTDPYLLLQDSKIWMDDVYVEQVSSKKDEKLGWLLSNNNSEEQLGLTFDSDIKYILLILDIYCSRTQLWKNDNGNIPTISPIGWNSEHLTTYGIKPELMHKWLIQNQENDNWNKGIKALRTNRCRFTRTACIPA